MPVYTFRNKKTNEEFESTLSIAEKEKFLKKNKHIEQIFTKMNIGDSVRLGIKKVPSDFSKYVLGRIKEKHPLGTALERRHVIQKEV